MLLLFLLIIVCLTMAACAILNQEKFGKTPEGDQLVRLESSPNYSDGEFRNQIPTTVLAEGQSTIKIIVNGWFSSKERLRPEEPLPTVRTDLSGPDALDRNKDVLIWLGHSAYFIQLGGSRILVDPVFSDHAAPFSFLNKTFPGTDLYTPDDMPEIDCLLITHDHWDHLDYYTVLALKQKVREVICPLGVGAYFEFWGYPKDRIREVDWYTTVNHENGLSVSAVPARHYSGRSFSKNKTLWAGFVIEADGRRIFLSGDSGYGPHFKDIANKFGKFNLAALDGGQYDSRWPLIHMTPEEAVRACEDLGAENMLLAHVGRFCISAHSWDEPFIRAAEAGRGRDFHLLTPKIGEPVNLDGSGNDFTAWWEGLN
ncbi:MBL fold metallo-hydrolase [Maridesulfovibrio sp.]|uniref:MBL fold metallo-hydrolase n=1 Tax=Maridesulfovibrio sp. TaxID=2795000 RepID=UPI002A18A2F0|nr:MBL fold metallo-hydrolase [Maridesulfovibrio sp.]